MFLPSNETDANVTHLNILPGKNWNCGLSKYWESFPLLGTSK